MPAFLSIERLEARIAPAAIAALNLSALDGSNGFKIHGEAVGDRLGVSVSGAGDVNGDGFDDVIVGTVRGELHLGGRGVAYVVFGQAGGFDETLDLASLDGREGFKLEAEVLSDCFGLAVSAAGDVNGDGFGDLLVGALTASRPERAM